MDVFNANAGFVVVVLTCREPTDNDSKFRINNQSKADLLLSTDVRVWSTTRVDLVRACSGWTDDDP